MSYGTFTISREELVKQLSSQHISLLSSIPIFFDDNLDKPIGYTEEMFDAENGLVCHVEDQFFEKYCGGKIEFRFGYKLNINSTGLKEIELNSVNLVPSD